MNEADRLFDTPAVPRLTDRQQKAYDAIVAAGYDGMHTEEIGALVHAHGEERCVWCSTTGHELGRALRDKGLVQQRRRKAPGGDTFMVWTVAGKLRPPRVERDNEGVIPY